MDFLQKSWFSSSVLESVKNIIERAIENGLNEDELYTENEDEDELYNKNEDNLDELYNKNEDEDPLEEIKCVLSEAIDDNSSHYEREFDVFLAHNSADKEIVRFVANGLRDRGLKPWLDEEQIVAGQFFTDVIQRAIGQVKSAAIFISPNELGKWQLLELRAFISVLVENDLTVIPVVLPGGSIPDNLYFLKALHWVEFCEDYDEDAVDDLVKGITYGS